MTKTITDVICPFCGTLCDDLEVVVSDDGKQLLEVYNACAIGAEKFLHSQAKDRITRPRMRQEDGSWKEITYDEAIEYTAQMLANAKKPLMYGWSSTNCEAQALGSELGEIVGAVMDNTATVCHGTSLIAVQDIGIPTCTKVIVVDPRPTDTANVADVHLQVEQGRDYELLNAFRVAFKGEKLPDVVAGIPKEKIYEAAETLKSGRFVIIFFGMGVTQSLGKNHNIDAAIAVTRDLNEYTKAAIMPMRGHYNVTGSGQVWGWLFGFPFAVDLSRGYARYNPGETTANDLLRRDEVDAVFVLGSDPGAHFPFSSVKKIYDRPSVAIDPHETPTTEVCKVHVPVAFVGVEVGGCAYRMDNVPIETRKVVEPPEGMMTDEEFLSRVLARVKEIKGV